MDMLKKIGDVRRKQYRSVIAKSFFPWKIYRYEEKQHTYNVTLRSVHVTTVAMETQQVLYICVCMWM